jgi:hypothetical protein
MIDMPQHELSSSTQITRLMTHGIEPAEPPTEDEDDELDEPLPVGVSRL